MRCLEARVSMQGARDDRGRDGLASPFVLGPAALCSGSGRPLFWVRQRFLLRLSFSHVYLPHLVPWPWRAISVWAI